MTDAPVLVSTITAFPGNIAYTFETNLARNPYVDQVVSRPIMEDDANMTVGIHVDAWEPDGTDPYEIGQEEPTFQRYTFAIEYLVRFVGDVAEGRNVHSRASKSIRAMLYRDPELALQLRRLSETAEGTIERSKRVVILRQRFFSNRMRSGMVHLSVIQGYVQTELQRL